MKDFDGENYGDYKERHESKKRSWSNLVPTYKKWLVLPRESVVTGIQNKKVRQYLGSNEIVQMNVYLGSIS